MRRSMSGGFSLTELVITIAVIGTLAGVGVPVALAQQAKAADASTKAALAVAASGIEQRLQSWRGNPPGALNICHTAGTYPAATRPTSNCADGTWVAKMQTGGAAVSPPLQGVISSGVTLTGLIAADGSYCLDGTNQRTGSSAFRFSSDMRKVVAGSCWSAGWTGGASQIGSGAATGVLPPAEPTGVITRVDTVARTVTVRWDAIAGTTYTVKVSGQPAMSVQATSTGVASCVFPATSCAGPASGTLVAGPYSATVRAGTTDGISAASSSDFTIPSRQADPKSIVNMGPPNPAPVAVAEGSRSNAITNPSAEKGIDGWRVAGTGALIPVINQVTSDRYVGASAVEVTKTAGRSEAYTSAAAVPAATYTGSAYVRVPTGQETMAATARLLFMNGSGAAIGSYATGTPVTVTAASGWTRVIVTGTAPAGTAEVRLLVGQATGATSGQRFLVDAMLLEQAPEARAYFDGDTANALWTGDKHASASIANVTEATRGRVKVSWVQPTAASGQEVNYVVTSSPGGMTCQIISSSACYVSGLDDDTTYTFAVQARTDGGVGTAGTSNAATTAPAPSVMASAPTVPQSVTAIPVAGGGIRVTWTAPASTGGSAITDYVLEQQQPGGPWVTIDEGTGTGTTWSSPGGLTRALQYSYRVSAVNSAGQGPASDVAATTPGYPPEAPTILSQPAYQMTTGRAAMTVAVPPADANGTVTYTTGYSTSASIASPSALPAGTTAAQVCDATTCTFTWDNTASMLGTKWYFYAFPTNNLGTGSPAIGQVTAPDATAVTHIAGTSVLGCPTDYPTDLGNGYCRRTMAYTYYTYTYTYTVTVWDGSYFAGFPQPGGCVDGWCPTATHQETRVGTATARNATPAGWLDSGSFWYQDTAKIWKSTWKVGSSVAWTDAGIATKNLGKMFIRGVEITTGASADLGMCPGGVAYELRGFGGTTTGTYTPPCTT